MMLCRDDREAFFTVFADSPGHNFSLKTDFFAKNWSMGLKFSVEINNFITLSAGSACTWAQFSKVNCAVMHSSLYKRCFIYTM